MVCILRSRANGNIIAKPAKELDRKVRAIVAVSSKPIVNKDDHINGKPESKPKYLKMSVVTGLNKNIRPYLSA